MLTTEGTMGFMMGNPEEDHELFLTTTKPPGWAKFKKNPKTFKAKETEKEVLPVVKTKRQQVMELVANNPRKGEATLLKLAKKEIGGSNVQLGNYIRLALLAKK
jgi:hypothetical protein